MTEEIKLTFLGTAGSVPTSRRNSQSMWIQYKGENILVDCGEGTQRQMRKAKLNPCKLNGILITHWHSDHVLGLPGLLQTMNLSGYNKKLYIYGPKGIKKLVKDFLKFFFIKPRYDIEIKEAHGKFLEGGDFYLEAGKMKHGIACNGYNFVKKDMIRINKSKLKKSKLPNGPHMNKLKKGKNIIYKGKRYLAKNLTYKEKGKKISIILDTYFHAGISKFVKDADLFIIESTFEAGLEDMAREKKHMTSKQDAQIAKKAKVKKLILTHLSDRYDKDFNLILGGAKKIFKNSHLVKDLDVVKI